VQRAHLRKSHPRLESLEDRLELSASLPANAIGASAGSVTRPGGTGSAAVTVAPKNLTPNKPSTIFGIFVRPTAGSGLYPRIVAVEQGDGQKETLRRGRPFVLGRGGDQAAAFVRVNLAGPLTVLVAGEHGSTGSFEYYATLAGDVNGDGAVNLADLQLFAPTYASHAGQPNYNLAADFNQNGVINLYDAKVLEHNMTALTPNQVLQAAVNLSPFDQAHYAASKNSGGSTFKKDVTIVGHTTPLSIVIEDTKAQDYSFGGAAVATDAKGIFHVNSTNKAGVNNNDLLILDPFGHPLIRSFPVFWIPFAAPGSKLR
jgi:hypothetical protein